MVISSGRAGGSPITPTNTQRHNYKWRKELSPMICPDKNVLKTKGRKVQLSALPRDLSGVPRFYASGRSAEQSKSNSGLRLASAASPPYF
ncbi:uncharacterized protein SPSK_10113 [Sporothrix schenckii 1099-18]|uniref:Uncharacterized protein n=1 Tax=Sporothrix schenckii 1099-18 TaxID=1397361 RepID=A0A0F2M6U5_SPOSC|nr:uncharacterized protein SPSK_10113 [Sporothrix schenckii 1099-18]KJR84520.1 hypothetical protein SPSK_10113 [Sporothrix schenckii 1099-18]